MTYVPRNADATVRNLEDISVNGIDFVSENHLHFLSMLGETVSLTGDEIETKDMNFNLYLKNSGLGKIPDIINLIINEDESTFVSSFLCFINI